MATAPATPFSHKATAEVVAAFELAHDPSAAALMQAYMRDQFSFFGIASPLRVEITREVFAGLAKPDEADLIALSRALWNRPERECQYAATWSLRRNVKQLTPDFIETVEHLITTKSWWDTIDDLAQNIVGAIVLANRTELTPTMDEWIESDNIWLARTAILYQNRFKVATDEHRLFSYCLERSGESEFFIRKGIGWALREYSKTNAKAVLRFVEQHDTELSGLSKREALKWLARRAARGDA